jgi:uncharacterized protein (DUF849 family)
LAEKVIITAALTGSIHTPSMSPYLPITPKQIADDAVRAAEAGAAIVHVHVRNPTTGQPDSDPALFREVLSSIKERSDVVVNITTGGGLGMSAAERIRTIPLFKPEMASLNMGSMNFGLYPMLNKRKKKKKEEEEGEENNNNSDFKFDWEPKYLESTRDIVFKNTFADAAYFCKTMYENGVKPEHECYDVGHIYNLRQLISDGMVRTPVHLQFVQGVLGGIGASPEDTLFMKATADRLIGEENYTYSVCVAGKMEFPICVLSATLGGHVRVGLEDNLYVGKGELAKSNSELVAKIRELVYDATGREAATPEKARQVLGLKGKDKTNF